MRITRQCDETEVREIFAALCDKADVWVGYAESDCPGMVSYSVVGYTIGRPTRRLFTVEERFVDDKGSRDCADKVCLHAVEKYLARYGCGLGARIGEFGVHGGNYEVECTWGREHSRPVRIVGRSYGRGTHTMLEPVVLAAGFALHP